MMNPKLILMCILSTAAAVLLNGCLMRQTVTSGGEVVEDNYVIKRPLKDAIENSE